MLQQQNKKLSPFQGNLKSDCEMRESRALEREGGVGTVSASPRPSLIAAEGGGSARR